MGTIFIVRVANTFASLQMNERYQSFWSLELSTAVELALEKGAEPAMGNKIDKVVVILNPVANGGFSVQAYEENAKPVFDCAGFDLTVKKTGKIWSVPNSFFIKAIQNM